MRTKAKFCNAIVLILTSLTVSCVSQQPKSSQTEFFRAPSSTPANESVAVAGFRKFCVQCHAQFQSSAGILANKADIYNRLKWLEGRGTPATTDMPQPPVIAEFQKIDYRDLRQQMLDYARPTKEELQAAVAYPLEKLKLPAGFKISLFAQVPGARSITQTPDGTFFVGTGGFANPKDVVYRIKDYNGDGRIEADEIDTPITGANNPNGVAFRNGTLYVAEVDRILAYHDIMKVARGAAAAAPEILPYTFPEQDDHNWKYIRFAPPPNDNWLYIAVGAPCNICMPTPPYQASIHRIDVVSGKLETVARGVRNSVGFDFSPETGNLWFTDNGRDMLGDDRPPDELNELKHPGAQHFGYPYCHGHGIIDPDIPFSGAVSSCSQTEPPMVDLAPHAAALGMRFYRGSAFPADYRGQIFIAEHGSWNRSKKSGYRVTVVIKKAGKLVYQPFISGWLDDSSQTSWGRPVDIQELPDGSMLVTDDGVPGSANDGAIYRVQYNGVSH